MNRTRLVFLAQDPARRFVFLALGGELALLALGAQGFIAAGQIGFEAPEATSCFGDCSGKKLLHLRLKALEDNHSHNPLATTSLPDLLLLTKMPFGRHHSMLREKTVPFDMRMSLATLVALLGVKKTHSF